MRPGLPDLEHLGLRFSCAACYSFAVLIGIVNGARHVSLSQVQFILTLSVSHLFSGLYIYSLVFTTIDARWPAAAGSSPLRFHFSRQPALSANVEAPPSNILVLAPFFSHRSCSGAGGYD
ncbi:Hypothetical_protein [Hexamita inflata]|uniref:Hypothetical_protein n=1 Tax=Hexamita inflata TaxID=28002 RepID=A0AA86PPK0_9EUKA|nr:Hypothetical protein HINF_LOCUS30088 [Hexamita inflata]